MNTQKRITHWLLSCISLCLLNSCEFTDKGQTEPAYLSIDSMDFDYGTQSEIKSKQITDAWVYVNSKFVGAFELPAHNIPIIPDGQNAVVWIQGGVFTDGIKTQRVTYPFYTRYQQNVTFNSGESLKITPKVAFSPNKILYEESFEQNVSKLENGTSATTQLMRIENVNAPSENGLHCAKIFAKKDTVRQIEVLTKEFFDVPASFRPVYLEITYKSTLPFAVGAYIYPPSATSYPVFDLILRPSATWKKVYVYLGEELFPDSYSHAEGSKFKVVFQAPADGKSDHTLELDNIRLLQ